MRIRSFLQHDLARLTELTIETFGPFYEDSFRPLMGEVVFDNQHGRWRDDYVEQVAGLHNPAQHRYVEVAEIDDSIAGYVAWVVDPARRNARVTILAVTAAHRRHHIGTALCGHAFGAMRALGAEVVTIGTGGDGFHAPARALYEALGCTALPAPCTTGSSDLTRGGLRLTWPAPATVAEMEWTGPAEVAKLHRCNRPRLRSLWLYQRSRTR